MSGMYSRSIDLTSFLVVHLFRHALFVTGTLWICALAFLFLVVLIATRTSFDSTFFPKGTTSHEHARIFVGLSCYMAGGRHFAIPRVDGHSTGQQCRTVRWRRARRRGCIR